MKVQKLNIKKLHWSCQNCCKSSYFIGYRWCHRKSGSDLEKFWCKTL